MRLLVVAVGRVADRALGAACADYAARLARTWQLETRDVRPPAGHLPTPQRLRREGERLLQAIPRDARAVALSRTGTSESSVAFARRLRRWRAEARDVAFVVGGADGLDQRVVARCELVLSLSAMTLPHELARLVLLEQLYRATTILQGTPYHRSR
jgi:23S rRNA (pseudouridine1915-N3)-methyltransferase